MFEYLRKRNFKVSEKRAAQLTLKLAKALYYLHCYGIIHRDIKPENILMTDDSEEAEPKILDFGLSKIIGPQVKCKEFHGTLYYAAPEVLLNKDYDNKVDIWALGVICYSLLIGQLP